MRQILLIVVNSQSALKNIFFLANRFLQELSSPVFLKKPFCTYSLDQTSLVNVNYISNVGDEFRNGHVMHLANRK